MTNRETHTPPEGRTESFLGETQQRLFDGTVLRLPSSRDPVEIDEDAVSLCDDIIPTHIEIFQKSINLQPEEAATFNLIQSGVRFEIGPFVESQRRYTFIQGLPHSPLKVEVDIVQIEQMGIVKPIEEREEPTYVMFASNDRDPDGDYLHPLASPYQFEALRDLFEMVFSEIQENSIEPESRGVVPNQNVIPLTPGGRPPLRLV